MGETWGSVPEEYKVPRSGSRGGSRGGRRPAPSLSDGPAAQVVQDERRKTRVVH